MRKKKKPTTSSLVAEARAKGLVVNSTTVNTAALLGTSGLTTNLADCTAQSVDVDWQRLPTSYWMGMSEGEWLSLVRAKAKAFGWESYHTLDSRGSESGFPDLVLARVRSIDRCKAKRKVGRLVYAELKDDGGALRADQLKWRDILRACGQDWFLWRPSDHKTVQMILEGVITR